MSFATSTLTGKYLLRDGVTPAQGTIEIIPNSPILIDPESNVILSGRVKVKLGHAAEEGEPGADADGWVHDGSFSVTLPSTDDTTVEPATGRQYAVSAKLKHTGLKAVVGIELAADETVDMADVTPVAEAAAAFSVFLTAEEYAADMARVAALEGAPPVTKASLGLGSVDNTSDAAKPVSALQQTALDAKLATSAADSTVAAKVNDLASATRVALSATYAAVGDAMRRTTQALSAPAPMIAHACGSGHTWAAGSGSTGTLTLNATDEVLLGTQSVKMVTNGAGGASRVDTPVAVDMTGKQPVIWVRVDDIAKAGTCDLYLGTSSSFASNYRFPIVASGATGRFLRSGAWVKMTLPWGAAVTTGTPTRSGITHCRVAFTDKGGSAPLTVHFAGLATQAESAAYPNGVCVFSFDDGRASAVAAKRTLDRYGFAATNYPIAERIDQGTAAPGGTWATYADLEGQQASGWEIAQHAYTVAAHDAIGAFTVLSPAALEAEFTNMKAWAARHGFNAPDHLAYPQGEHNQAVLDATRRFFASARTVTFQSKESYPPADPYRVRMFDLGGISTLANAQAHITAAVAGKGMAVFMGHEVGSGGTTLEWSQANYDALIASAASSGIAVRTMSQAMRGI